MLLISGPAASGKTSICLDRLRQSLKARQTGAILLVPTTTMAEHLRNELVREGLTFSPSTITTFTKFASTFFGAAKAVNTAALELIVEEALNQNQLTSYGGVREFAGFRRTLVRSLEEFATGGGDDDLLAQCGADPDLQLIHADVTAQLKRRGLHWRSTLLRAAAVRIAAEGANGTSRIWLAGFFSFTPPELEVLEALSNKVELTIALTNWEGAQRSLTALRRFAKHEHTTVTPPNRSHRTLVKAPSLDRETAEIARRIIEHIDQGRQFRDIGIILRSQVPYAASVQTALERFGIPYRLYFGDPLTTNATSRYLLGLVDAMLSGWEHQSTLAALRLPGSPLRGADRFEYAVLKNLPGAGLQPLCSYAAGESTYFDNLEKLTPWVGQRFSPIAWAARFAQLRSLVESPPIREPVDRQTSILWREQSLALDEFDKCLKETSEALSPEAPLTCQHFLTALRTVLTTHTLRNIDRRRNVVHVIDAFEARQWKLPIVFVPGLLEKQFPHYQSENPVLPDTVRRRLQNAGIPLRTSREREQDERFLFDIALSRATHEVILSYPELNAKGDENLPSFFLKFAEPYQQTQALECRPQSKRPRSPEPYPSLYDEALRAHVAAHQTKASASRIEMFLQCPFQFFASHTLKLKEAPTLPEERLNPMVQGNIAHKTLEHHYGQHLPLDQAFNEAFETACQSEGVQDSYRTEAVRLDLLHNVRLLLAEGPDVGARSHYELPFRLLLDDITVSGVIDRIEIDAQGRASVFDYKYRSKERLGAIKRQWDNGALVQAGLYAMAAQSEGLQVHSVHYLGFKREYSQNGWNREGLIAIIQQAKERTLTAVQQLRDGRIEPLALDDDKCRYCAFSMACRKEAYAMHRVAVKGATS